MGLLRRLIGTATSGTQPAPWEGDGLPGGIQPHDFTDAAMVLIGGEAAGRVEPLAPLVEGKRCTLWGTDYNETRIRSLMHTPPMRVDQAEQIHPGILTLVPPHVRDEWTPALGVTLLTGWAGTIEHDFSNALLPHVDAAAKRGTVLAVECAISARPGDVTVRAVIPGGPRGGARLQPASTLPATEEVGMSEDVRTAARKAFRGRKADPRFLVYTGWGDELEVVGESHHQETLLRVRDTAGEWMPGNRTLLPAMLVHDFENPHDQNAVGVWLDGWLVGFLKRDDAARWAPYLDSQAPRLYIAKAKLTGGTERYPNAGCILHASMSSEDVRA